MKNLKRILAAALVLAMALTAAACHPKDEIAVTVGDVEFTSAYYMCALINADSEAKSRVQEELSDDESTTDIDYYSKKIDDKDYVTWVEDTAMDYLKKIAAYKTLCKDNELELERNGIAPPEPSTIDEISRYINSEHYDLDRHYPPQEEPKERKPSGWGR